MKSKSLIVILAALALSGCEEKHKENQNELRPIAKKHKEARGELRPMEEKHKAIRNELILIQRTTNDTKQPDYIRESAVIFEKILREENDISIRDWIKAIVDMKEQNNETTISTYVSFLKALEKKLPDKLPPVEAYQAMEDKEGKADIIEFNVARTILMIGSSIKDISLYGDPAADAEIEGILQRFKERYDSSEAGAKILEYFNMEHGQGIQARAEGIKPWESPRRPPVYIPKREPRQP
jgi:predicted house-cleaning noncanonical NTP pyrophosphatase (MazG superfamily)